MKFLSKKNKIKFLKTLKMKIKKKKINKHIQFQGWGMTTTQAPPWIGVSTNKTYIEFNKAEKILFKNIKLKKFNLSQFSNEKNILEVLKSLRYRHYIVYYSSLLAFSGTKSRNIVECGVCDGLTVFFAINKFNNSQNFKAFLYDSWSDMKAKYLITKSEKKEIGSYDYLDVNSTKKNLINYKKNLIFNKGYIPESFKTSLNPKTISWLHIDLNSSLPTEESLKFFFPRLEKNGVILFDDYGWKGYEDSRKIIEKFLKNKKGDFFHLPTGQAFFIKR